MNKLKKNVIYRKSKECQTLYREFLIFGDVFSRVNFKVRFETKTNKKVY